MNNFLEKFVIPLVIASTPACVDQYPAGDQEVPIGAL